MYSVYCSFRWRNCWCYRSPPAFHWYKLYILRMP